MIVLTIIAIKRTASYIDNIKDIGTGSPTNHAGPAAGVNHMAFPAPLQGCTR